MRYKSCDWIESGISFDVNSYKVCCLYSSKSGGNTIVKENYNGEKIDWDTFFEFKNEIKKLHKNGKINKKCIGCVNLVEEDWESEKSKVSIINLDYWTKCNSCCSYCFTMKDKEKYNLYKNYKFLPILEDMLQNNILSPNGYISFGGGEVTLLDEFEVILNKLIDFGFTHIKIHTSCIEYSQAIERGLENGCIELIVSVDSGSKTMHEKIKQVKSYVNVWENLKKYAQHQKGTSVVKTKYILIPNVNDSISEIDLWLEKSKEIGVNSVLQEIESEWFYSRRDNVPDYVIKYFDYAKQKADELGLNYDLYERAQHMFAFYNEKKSNFILWCVKNFVYRISNLKSKIFSFLSRLC